MGERKPPCSVEGPPCPCGALHVHCLLAAGHHGDHHHDSRGTDCDPITWPSGSPATEEGPT